MALFILLYFL